MAAKPQTARYHQFKQLLRMIATGLGEADVQSLVSNQDLPEELKDALGVLQKLEREGLFSDRNIRPLAELLRAIERHDLVNNYVQEYIQKFGSEFKEEEEEKTDGVSLTRQDNRPLVTKAESPDTSSPEVDYPPRLHRRNSVPIQHPRTSSNACENPKGQHHTTKPPKQQGATKQAKKSSNWLSLFRNKEDTKLNESVTVSWEVKRSEFVEPLFYHKNNCIEKKVKVSAGFGPTKLKLNINFKLFPNGVNWDQDSYSTLKIEVTSPSQTLSSDVHLQLVVTGADCETGNVITSRQAKWPLHDRAYIIKEFIAHEILKVSSAQYFEFKATLRVKYSLSKDCSWVVVNPINSTPKSKPRPPVIDTGIKIWPSGSHDIDTPPSVDCIESFSGIKYSAEKSLSQGAVEVARPQSLTTIQQYANIGSGAVPKEQSMHHHQFKQLLHKIATQLGEADVQSLVSNQDLPEELKDALGVLQKLEQEGLFSDRNIRPLAELLRAIERHDLVNNYVQEYIQKFSSEFKEEEENDGSVKLPEEKMQHPMSLEVEEKPSYSQYPVVRSKYQQEHDIAPPITFGGDHVALEIPDDGIQTGNGWEIKPLHKACIKKDRVNNFSSESTWVPECVLLLKWKQKDKAPEPLEYKVKLLGTGDDDDFFLIVHHPGSPLASPVERDAPTVVRQTESPVLTIDDLVDVTKYLVNLGQTDIYHLGLILGLNHPHLKNMESSRTFKEDMIAAWLQKKDQVTTRGLPTWETLVKALRDDQVKQNGVADKIASDKITCVSP